MRKRKLRTFDEAQIEYYRAHPGELESYLQVALEAYQNDGDEKVFLSSLSMAAKARGGFSKLARGAGLNRENLYRVLSAQSDPRFSTVMQVLHMLGFGLRVRDVGAQQKRRSRCGQSAVI
ncbi:MAG: putative addiction module antidote protein [Candidatus Omnitrophica bacterium]|nr:putative addiction module antidote protein [Candidatus Omnitrophota bacterium]